MQIFCQNTVGAAPPTGYDLNGNLVPVYVYPEKASGGLFATAEDMAMFAMAGMGDNPVLSPESIELLYTPVSPSGWELHCLCLLSCCYYL